MQAAKEDAGTCVEEVLCTIAVVDIPIEDADSFHSVSAFGVMSCDGDVIKNAKALRFFLGGVVTGRAGEAEGASVAITEDGIDATDGGTGGEESGVVRILADAGFPHVDGGEAFEAGLLDKGAVFAGMDSFDPAGGSGCSGMKVKEGGERSVIEGLPDGLEPFRRFRVVATGVVGEAEIVGVDGNRAGHRQKAGRRSGIGSEGVADSLEVGEGIEAGLVAIAKDEADGVATDAVKTGDGDAGEFGAGIGTVDAAEDVGLTHVIGAGGKGAELIHRIKILAPVGPADGDLVSDEVDGFRRRNESHGEDCVLRAR